MINEILAEIRDETGGEMVIDEDEVKGIAVISNKYIVAFKPMERCTTGPKGVVKYAETMTFWRKSKMCETTYKTHIIGQTREFLSKKTIESVQDESKNDIHALSLEGIKPVTLDRKIRDFMMS